MGALLQMKFFDNRSDVLKVTLVRAGQHKIEIDFIFFVQNIERPEKIDMILMCPELGGIKQIPLGQAVFLSY